MEFSAWDIIKRRMKIQVHKEEEAEHLAEAKLLRWEGSERMGNDAGVYI